MKVLVPVKRVIDYNVKVRVKADGSGVDLANVKMSMRPMHVCNQYGISPGSIIQLKFSWSCRF